MRLGLILGATVVVPDLTRALFAFGRMGFGIRQESTLARARALALGRADLADARGVLLGLGSEALMLAVFASDGPSQPTVESCGWGGLSLAMDDETWRALCDAPGSEAHADTSGRIALNDVPGFFLARSASGHPGALLLVPDAAAARAFYVGLGLAPVPAQPGCTSVAGRLAGGGHLHFLHGRELPIGMDRPFGMQALRLARVDSHGRRLAGVPARLIGGAIGERLELV